MKNKKVFIGLAAILSLCLIGCGKKVDFETVSQVDSEIAYAENQLMATDVTSEEDAQKIAEEYGIEFKELSEGVATFHTDDDPLTVIERGEKEGLTQLYVNQIRTIN